MLDISVSKKYFRPAVQVFETLKKVPKTSYLKGAGHPSWVSRTHPSFPLNRIKGFIDSLGYISTTFAMLNKRMYAGTITDKDAGVVERITSALKRFPMFSGTTYRNLKFSNEEMYNNFLSEYAEGNLLTLEAFTSTSKRPNGYPKFGQYTIHMVIEGISGADISSSYGVPCQQEVILLPGTTLKINKVSLANDGSPIIFAQEVSTYGVE